ncbi:zinc finger, C2H2 type, partial [Teladorsagia circumcincta]
GSSHSLSCQFRANNSPRGEFLCGHCGKTFCHAASLNRHRLNFHGDDQHCQLCDAKIPGFVLHGAAKSLKLSDLEMIGSAHETVRRHMGVHHAINRVFTCGCCNWTFPDKKELHAHNNSMMRTGHPGEAKAIAISSRPPGSLSQAELRGEEHGSPRPPAPKTASRKKDDKPNAAQLLFGQLMNMTPSTSIDEETSNQNKNLINNNNIEFSVLNVKTENDVVLSGPESGIASGEEVSVSCFKVTFPAAGC